MKCGICRRNSPGAQWMPIDEYESWTDAFDEETTRASIDLANRWPYRVQGDDVEMALCRPCLGDFVFSALRSPKAKVLDRGFGKGFTKALQMLIEYWLDGDALIGRLGDIESEDLESFLQTILGNQTIRLEAFIQLGAKRK